MSWQKYDLVFRLQSPLHIGWRKTSNLMQTRGYVMGKNLWAALTARLTCQTGEGDNGQAYVETGKAVQTCFRFSYLYPALKRKNNERENNDGYEIWYPWCEGFDYLFLNSYTSTAVDSTTKSATEGLLHDTEYVAPFARNDDPFTRNDAPVYLKGYCYVQNTESVQGWQKALGKLQVGGERGYGWGRLKLMEGYPQPTGEPTDKPISEIINGRVTAHLKADSATGVTGPIEPLLGWQRNNEKDRRSKWHLSQAMVCYEPGSSVTQPTPPTLYISSEYGLLTTALENRNPC